MQKYYITSIINHPPYSLVNIYKELQDDIEEFSNPKHGNLTGWAQQGIQLSN
jgi:uracil-DNA glycosylase